MREIIRIARQRAGERVVKTYSEGCTLSGWIVGYEDDMLVVAHNCDRVRGITTRCATSPVLLAEPPCKTKHTILTAPTGLRPYEDRNEDNKFYSWVSRHIGRVAFFKPYGPEQKGLIVGHKNGMIVIRVVYTKVSKFACEPAGEDYNSTLDFNTHKAAGKLKRLYTDVLVSKNDLRLTKLVGIENIC